MTHPRTLFAAFAALLLLLVSCQQTPVSEQEQIAQRETVLAGTPSATPSPTVTPSPEPSLTPTSTVGPTATPTPSPTPSATPLPPTPTSNPALKDFSYCTQQVGDADGGRFAARLTSVKADSFPAFERVTFVFTDTVGAVPLSATADCLSERDFVATTGEPVATRPYVLQLDLANWLHDERFRQSTVTNTYTLTNTRILTNVDLRYDAGMDAGLTFSMPISEPLRFHLTLLRDPPRLVLETAKTRELTDTSDPLNVPLGESVPKLSAPVFFLYEGDIWRTDAMTTTNLTQSPEQESWFAPSPDGKRIAFCRAAPGVDPTDAQTNGPSSLFAMDADGKNATQIGRAGLNCADPAWSPDGKTIAWSVDETGITPAQRTIWTVAASGGPAKRAVGGSDEWSRFAPQWLANGVLVYAATAQDGRNTLFRLGSDGKEQDIGAELVVGDRYTSLGRPLADRKGSSFAVEAQRARNPGSDLVVLDAQGKELDTISSGYWTRPLGWRNDGGLLFLTSDCISTLVQNYTLGVLNGGKEEVLTSGTSLNGISSAVATGEGVAYTLLEHPQPGARGPGAVDPSSPSSLWLWDTADGKRARLYDADRAMINLQR